MVIQFENGQPKCFLLETPGLWKWEKRSTIHRQKFVDLHEYAKAHPTEIKEVNGVRVCCSIDFRIGKGRDGTRVYLGLAKDGVEKAVKRLPKDACSRSAEQEMKILNELASRNSKHVVNYWFLEYESDKEYLFLIMDLCEETLENFVNHSSDTDLVTCAPHIVQDILKGLFDLHHDPEPILHRDLKPSNILRNIQGDWLLADFGISRILSEDAATHVTMPEGTEGWEAVESCHPEAITDDGKCNVRYKKKSDIQVFFVND
jgi:serine/threonine protein kinase